MPAKKSKPKKAKVPPVEEAPKKEVKRRKDCPDCGSDNIMFDTETEQLICQDCGLIFEELPEDMEKAYKEEDELL